MKTFILSALLLGTVSANARSILVFKTTLNCQTYSAQAAATVDIQEAQDGQSRLLVDLKNEKLKLEIVGKKILPPRMMAGGATRYVGKDAKTNIEGELTLGVRPMKVGKLVGRAARLELKNRSELNLVCTFAK